MPDAIRRIARKHLSSPAEVTVKMQSVTNDAIHQRVWMTAGAHKMDALTRILEVEDFDAVIVFVRTRIATSELADKLAARGYAAAALNGDVPQKLREKSVEQLKKGQLDILVATDVAARGLDVERISHVINYDIPYDVEAYVHRIGRTGRAGRKGEAILFAANRERRLLKAIEKATGKAIEKMELPSAEQVADKRADRFRDQITETLASRDVQSMRDLIEQYQNEHDVALLDIAAALAVMAQAKSKPAAKAGQDDDSRPYGRENSPRPREERPRKSNADRPKPDSRPEEGRSRSSRPEPGSPEKGMQRYRIEVGHSHGVKPGNIVGAIANEGDIDSRHIGHIDIFDDHSTVDLPDGMPSELFKQLQGVWVSGQRLQISLLGNPGKKHRKPAATKTKPKSKASKRPAKKRSPN